MIHDLHHLARVHAGQIAQELEPELRLIVQRPDHGNDVAWADPDLGLVMALPDGAQQPIPESGLETRLEEAIHA